MSSHQSTDEPHSCHITCPNLFQIVKIGPIATFSKNLLSKIMSVRIFRGRGSLKFLENFDVGETDETRQQMGLDAAQLCDRNSAQNVDEKHNSHVSDVGKDTEPLAGNDMLLSPVGEQGDTHVESDPISALNRTYEGYRVNSCNEVGETHNQSPSDIITAKKTKKVCTDLNEINPCSSSKPSTTTSTSGAIDNVDGDTVEKGKLPCHDSEEYETTMGEPEHSGLRAESETGTFSDETTHPATSDDKPNEAYEAHEAKDIQHGTHSSTVNESPAFGSEQLLRMESSDMTASCASKSESSSGLGVRNDIASALESTVGGAGATSCRTIHNVNDEAFHTNENHIVDPVQYDSFAKPDVKQRTDPEKAERMARRRKLLAKKKEARLRKAIEYAARDAPKKEIMCSSRLEVKSLGTAPSIAVDTVHLGGGSVTFKSGKPAEDEKSERARWSKEEAQQARERRKYNQRKRLLKLMAVCAQ